MVSYSQKRAKQQGSVLLVALMVLIVLTLLTFSSSKSVILQEKMTSTTRDSILALEAAEAALREAESDLVNPTKSYSKSGGSDGRYDGTKCESDATFCAYLDSVKDVFADSTWVKSTKASKGVACGNGVVGCQVFGRYIAIKLGEINLSLKGSDEILVITSDSVELGKAASGKMFKYKVIARGVGQNPDINRVLVSYYAVPEIN